VLIAIVAGAPPFVIVPVVKVAAVVPEFVRLNPFRSITPLYPLTVTEATVGAMSNIQLPWCPPAPLNMTASDAPGTEAPPIPPEVADQFAVLFQFEEVDAIQ
jgi:hypothetical protein